MRALDMKVKPGGPGERFLAALDAAHESVDVKVAPFMVLQVLFQLECFPAGWVVTLENSVGKLKKSVRNQ